MIPNRLQKASTIIGIITGRIADINARYGGGPSLHFYHRILDLRRQHPAIGDFLASPTCLEVLYATLVSWNMNSRGAEMKDYADFKTSLQANIPRFQAVESAAPGFSWTNRHAVLCAVSNLYEHLSLMKTRGILVSNSKSLHFMFPTLFPPMDGANILKKLYGHAAESKNKYLEVLNFAYDIIGNIHNPRQYLDALWNTTEIKLFDNAIILI